MYGAPLVRFRIVLCSEIRGSRAESSPHTRALKLEHQSISNITGVTWGGQNLLYTQALAQYWLWGLTAMMLIINLKIATPSESWRENTEDPSRTLPRQTRLEFCQYYQPVHNSSITNLTLELSSDQLSSCMAYQGSTVTVFLDLMQRRPL